MAQEASEPHRITVSALIVRCKARDSAAPLPQQPKRRIQQKHRGQIFGGIDLSREQDKSPPAERLIPGQTCFANAPPQSVGKTIFLLTLSAFKSTKHRPSVPWARRCCSGLTVTNLLSFGAWVDLEREADSQGLLKILEEPKINTARFDAREAGDR
jgi:hypothetical protein